MTGSFLFISRRKHAPLWKRDKKGRGDMDEMLIKLRTKFMRKVVSKLISKSIKSKTGYEIDIQFDELNASFEDGEITVKANLEAKLSKDEFMKILKSQGLD